MSVLWKVLRLIGHLPGDLFIQKPGFQFYLPITSCVLISVIISLIFYIVLFFNR